MFLANILRFIGPVKLIVLCLALLLPIVEFADGAFDVGDVCASLILLLLLDDILNTNLSFFLSKDNPFNKFDGSKQGYIDTDEAEEISFKGNLQKSFFLFESKEGVLFNHHFNSREGVPDKGTGKDPLWRSFPMRKRLAYKKKMSMVFLFLMMLPIVLDWFRIPETIYELTFAVIMILWSIALFTTSLLEYRKSPEPLKLKLFYCHLAAFVFLVGVARLAY